jgi:hypothetical protein
MNIWNILLVSTETIWNIWTLAHLWHSSFRRPTSSGGKHVTTAFLCSILYLGWSQYPPSLSMVHPRVPVQVLPLETMSINVCQVHRMLNLYRTQRKKKTWYPLKQIMISMISMISFKQHMISWKLQLAISIFRKAANTRLPGALWKRPPPSRRTSAKISGFSASSAGKKSWIAWGSTFSYVNWGILGIEWKKKSTTLDISRCTFEY